MKRDRMNPRLNQGCNKRKRANYSPNSRYPGASQGFLMENPAPATEAEHRNQRGQEKRPSTSACEREKRTEDGNAQGKGSANEVHESPTISRRVRLHLITVTGQGVTAPPAKSRVFGNSALVPGPLDRVWRHPFMRRRAQKCKAITSQKSIPS